MKKLTQMQKQRRVHMHARPALYDLAQHLSTWYNTR